MKTKPGNYSGLAGKTAVVTGGSHGVGSGICRELSRQGVQVDVTDQDQVRGLRGQAEDAYGPVDIACACAGGQGDPISIGELDLDAWKAYAAAKSGLIMLSRQTALQVAAADVRVNMIALGPVFEGKPVPQQIQDRVAQMHPLQRTGSWADVGSAVAFLVSDASAWVTGATLDLSGGRVML